MWIDNGTLDEGEGWSNGVHRGSREQGRSACWHTLPLHPHPYFPSLSLATVAPRGGGAVPWLGGMLQCQELCILGFKMEVHKDGGGGGGCPVTHT